MDKHFQHALVLLGQGRYDLAEGRLRESLSGGPGNALAHSLLADCLRERGRLQDAEAEARQSIGLEPDLAEGHAALARVLNARNRHEEAERAAREAVRLDPDDPDHFATLSAVHLGRRDWPAAVNAAEEGLARDPEHVASTNLRAMALVQLGRKDEAGVALASALARDPENAFSHANQGWALLHKGDRRKALEHFREALRLEPGLDYPRAGIVEALKSKNLVYSAMLRYFLWMGRQSRQVQWVIILAGYFGAQGLSGLAARSPDLAPWIRPVLVAYLIFVALSWLSSPFFNLLLRLDRFGKHALSREQVISSNCFAALLAPALALAAVWLVTDNTLAFLGACYLGLLLFPFAGILNCPKGWPRWAMIAYTTALAVVGLVALPLMLVRMKAEGLLALQTFMWGCLLSGFPANFLAMQAPRK